jgi:hypothetical protein
MYVCLYVHVLAAARDLEHVSRWSRRLEGDRFQHTSAYVSIRQHTSAYVSIRQHTSADLERAGPWSRKLEGDRFRDKLRNRWG